MTTHISSTSALTGLLLAVATGGCMPGAGLDKEKLVQTASFDHDCPQEKVRLVNEQDDGMAATGRYVLDVCGEKKKYKRAGTLYYDADTGLVMDGKKIAN